MRKYFIEIVLVLQRRSEMPRSVELYLECFVILDLLNLFGSREELELRLCQNIWVCGWLLQLLIRLVLI